MTEAQIDEVYTEACRTMTTLGEAKTELFLARLALLLMHEVDDAARIRAAIAEAGRGL